MKNLILIFCFCLIALPLAVYADEGSTEGIKNERASEKTVIEQSEKIDAMIETLTPNATIETLRIKKDDAEIISPRAQKTAPERLSNKIKWQRPQKHHYKKKN